MAIIEVDGLVKHYGTKKAVDGVSFTVEEGEIFALLGPNGAGKTTTVESIEGIRKPDRGRISVLGLDPQKDRDELRHVLGAQLQESQLPEKLRVGEALDLFASFYRDPADPATLLDMLGLTSHRDQPYKKLSGGQKQRLSIALARWVVCWATCGVTPNSRTAATKSRASYPLSAPSVTRPARSRAPSNSNAAARSAWPLAGITQLPTARPLRFSISTWPV